MKALIVYDSVFGNTEKVALAMKSALGQQAKVVRVSDVVPEMLNGIGLLIVGSPTRGFRPTQPMTDFIKSLDSKKVKDIKIAAFDTRVDINEVKSKVLTFMVNRFGYAAPFMTNILVKHGGKQAAEPEGFFVLDREGPMKDGEIKRAEAWARKLVK